MGDDESSIFEAQRQPANPEDQCLCDSPYCQQVVLSQELDTILNPKTIFQTTGQVDRIWSLIHTKRFDLVGFVTLLSEYRSEHHCGFAWSPGYVAYRCRTCSKALTMSLCNECFRNGNHEGHDYNMFKSRSGGACDCGFSMVNESGHCKRHGKNAIAIRSREPIPINLICAPKRLMPRLIHRLAIQLRRSHVDLSGENEIYLDYLSQIAKTNVILRDLMIEALINEDAYSNQVLLLSNHHDKDVARIVNEGLKKFKRERKGLVSFKIQQQWGAPNNITAFCDNLTYNCFVDELLFWTVVFEFPQKLVCFLLSFLMDDRYKRAFSRAFVNHYTRIVMMLAGVKGQPIRHLRDSFEQLSRRILQITVQIYNNADLTRMLCEEEHTLHTVIYCLRAAIEGCPSDGLKGVLMPNPLCPNSNGAPKVVCCDNLTIRDCHLGSFTEDLNAILDFDHEVKRLINDKNLLNVWLEMLCYFQTMSPYKRELGEHTPYEIGPHVSVFSIESDFCLSPFWLILCKSKDSRSVKLVESLLLSIHENLSSWFHRMGIGPGSHLDPYHMSFHIPLHRMFAATIRHLLFTQQRNEQEVYKFISDCQSIFGSKYGHQSNFGSSIVINTGDFLKILLLHPLQALTLYHETRNGMWTRNGIMTMNQSITYVHSAYCHSTIDLDMFLVRYCASKLNPNQILKILMSRFHAWKWLSFKSNTLMDVTSDALRRLHHFHIEPEHMIQMVESALIVIIQLLTLDLHCNISEKHQHRQEIISLISVIDRPHSHLVDMLPDKGGTDINHNEEFLSKILDELTVFKPAQHGNGGNLQQGCYTLKPNIWDDEYNPIYVQYRFYQKRDYQMSLERFFQNSKLTGKLEKRHHPSALWPPLLVPHDIGEFGELSLGNIVLSSTLIGIVFSILYKDLYIVDVPDTIMAYAVYLLELSLRKSLDKVKLSHNSGFVEPPNKNSSFNGEYCYNELTSAPAHLDSKGEVCIRGNKICTSLKKQGRDTSDSDDPKVFPVVKHALDLAFETTWFPFESVVENCLVHVENIHSLSAKEFEAILKCPLESDDLMSSEASQMTVHSRNSISDERPDIDMSWSDFDPSDDEGSVGIDEEAEELENENEDNDDDDDEDDDDDDDYDSDDDDDDNDDANEDRPGADEVVRPFNVRVDELDNIDEMDTSTRASTRQTVNGAPGNQMEVDSLPETQSSALRLVPIRPTRSDQSSQVDPENLVTERRAILASDPRPMVAGPVQPLALECSSQTRNSNRHHVASSTNREERSLSETDIQARFTGFFHEPDTRMSPGFRGFRQRQMAYRGGFRQRQIAHRGGFRNSVFPFAVHNPNSAQSPNNANQQQQPPQQPQPQSSDMYHPVWHHSRRTQTSRQAIVHTLINRAQSTRLGAMQRAERRLEWMHHGESLLSLLLRLHGKYSQRARSYHYNELRAQENASSTRSRLGDGVHFVTIVLDLICTLDQRMRAKLEQLQELIWGDRKNLASEQTFEQDKNREQEREHEQGVKSVDTENDSKTNSADAAGLRQGQELKANAELLRGSGTYEQSTSESPSCSKAKQPPLSVSERRRRAKEFQSKLMAEFANKQRAFIEKYESVSRAPAHTKSSSDKIEAASCWPDEEPLNLSSKLGRESKPQMSDSDKQTSEAKQQLAPTRQSDKSTRLNEPQTSKTATDIDIDNKTDKALSATYECCICGVEGPSDLANPLGQVVLLQSTSVLGHGHLRPSSERRLPCNEEQLELLKEETYAKHLELRIDLLCEHFSESSWLDSINIGAEGGVHVQSCGHYLHIECHQSYIKSLDQTGDRPRSRGDSDEFLCPVCRQIANSVLPILSDPNGANRLSVALARGRNLDDRIALIGSLLKERLPPNQRELQSSATFCSHLTKATGPQYRLVRSNASMHSLFLFLTSIARTNLETEVILRSTRGYQEASARRNCFLNLFNVLALNAQTLINDRWFTCDQIWSHLTYRIDEKNRLGVKPINSEVPLLLRDPTAMLLQFLFAISGSLCYQANFTCLVQLLFNLNLVQSVALVLSYFKPIGASLFANTSQPEATTNTSDFRAFIGTTVAYLGRLLEPRTGEPLMNSTARACWRWFPESAPDSDPSSESSPRDVESQLTLIESRVKLTCLPYLRAAALIQMHLYQRAYPRLRCTDDEHLLDQQAIAADFQALVCALKLGPNSCQEDANSNLQAGLESNPNSHSSCSFLCAVHWPPATSELGRKLVASWSNELLRFYDEFSIAARSLLLSRSLVWRRPALMQLPHAFDDIFMFYYRQTCSLCNTVPKDVAVCLVCGAPICFRVSCCRDRSRSRQVHSQHCGANTAVFLAVHTSSVVVIRGNRACVWGSVYLDAHDEEDSGLQRGKPLYLVPARFELLEQQWLSHNFDHTCGKRWIYLQDNQ